MQRHFHVLVHVYTEKGTRDVAYPNPYAHQLLQWLLQTSWELWGELRLQALNFYVVSGHLRILDPSHSRPS